MPTMILFKKPKKNAGGARTLGNRRSSTAAPRPSAPFPVRQKTILIGYGSRIRGDDAAGLVLAERFAECNALGLRAIATPQLYPELAHEISGFGQVIFVDAMIASTTQDTVDVHELRERASNPVFGHAYSPERIVEMARTLYGATPRAWIITIPGFDFEWKESLSPASEEALKEAAKAVVNLVERYDAENHSSA